MLFINFIQLKIQIKFQVENVTAIIIFIININRNLRGGMSLCGRVHSQYLPLLIIIIQRRILYFQRFCAFLWTQQIGRHSSYSYVVNQVRKNIPLFHTNGFYLICDSTVFISLVAYKKLMTRTPHDSILYSLMYLTILLHTCKDNHERGRLLETLINDGMPLFYFQPY